MKDRTVKQALVVGAGLMGSRIAGHLANAGISSYLLDILPSDSSEEELKDKKKRNALALKGIAALKSSDPAALYSEDLLDRITPGNLEDDLYRVGEVDWVIEAVVEKLQIKKSLLARMGEHLKKGTIISTNTSGISINKIAVGLPKEHRPFFLGTHFFNPPRYMKLLEIIPAQETEEEVLDFICALGREVLGKEVVLARDTTNFIANRLGTYGMASTIKTMVEEGLSIEAVDALTGQPVGRPRTASFRTLDMVGLDTFLHVANNIKAETHDPNEAQVYSMPDFVTDMAEKGWLGLKSGKGFYQKIKDDEGESQILTLNYETMEYRAQEKVRLNVLDEIRNLPGFEEKIQALVQDEGKAGRFIWKNLKDLLLFTARKLPEIADSIIHVDRAMRFGYNWQRGPFALWDALGVSQSVERMRKEGDAIPEVVEGMLALGKGSFYLDEEGMYYDYQDNCYKRMDPDPHVVQLPRLKKEEKVVLSNPGASLIDMGDGVALLEFTSPNNTIGEDVIQMMNDGLDAVEKDFDGMILGNQGHHFCVGANLMLILMEAQCENWFSIDLIVQEFQKANMRMKYFHKPIVAAPFGMTLGGGCELCLHTHRVHAAAETYIGLVELGVGLIPAGGGTKEMVLRSIEGVEEVKDLDHQPLINQVFERVAMAKVARSALEGKALGYLRKNDRITINDRHLLSQAKKTVLGMITEGFKPLEEKKIPVLGEEGQAVLNLGIYTLLEGRFISEYDAHLGRQLAYIMTGGHVKAGTLVGEQYLLDLEREVFMALLEEPQTQERMEHMLKYRKPLRN